jgi:hypothetical protein
MLLPRVVGRSLVPDLAVNDTLDASGGCTGGGVGWTTVGTTTGVGDPREQEPPHQGEAAEEDQGAQGGKPPTFVGGRCDCCCVTHVRLIPI